MSIKNLKEKERENRIDYIIDAAEQLFFEKGYDGVSLNEIALKIGISRPALYRYFKNREEIYFAVVLRAAKIMNQLFKKSANNNDNARIKLEKMGKAYFKFYKDFPNYYEIYLSFEFLRFQNNEKYDISEIMKLNFETIKIICETIEEGMEDGSIRKDINPLETAMFITTTSNSVLKLYPNTTKTLGISIEQYYDDFLRLWDRALMDINNK